jgi:hypothetical protein
MFAKKIVRMVECVLQMFWCTLSMFLINKISLNMFKSFFGFSLQSSIKIGLFSRLGTLKSMWMLFSLNTQHGLTVCICTFATLFVMAITHGRICACAIHKTTVYFGKNSDHLVYIKTTTEHKKVLSLSKDPSF